MNPYPVLGLVCAFALASTSLAKLPRSTPEAQGIASRAILNFIEEADRKVDAIHSFMLVRHGHVVAEGWWAPYAAEERHMMFSLSKSFTSTAVGLAIADGQLSLDDPVLKFFPEDAPAEPSGNLRAMRVRDLLTMSTGQHEETIRGFPYQADENLVKRFLALPVDHKPGTHFVYNTPATYILSAIVQKVTGQTVLEYLRPRLFQPLDIEDPTWDASAQGVTLGGFGLNVRTEDIAAFGELYLKRGDWRGNQLVPASWVDVATSRQVSNGSNPNSDWEQGYGFQFWRSRHNLYRGDGAHGQFCLIFPEHDAVVAITSGTRDMGQVMNLVWEHLLPALGDQPLAANAAEHRRLTERLGSLQLAVIKGAAESPQSTTASGKRFVFPENAQGITAVRFDFDAAGESAIGIEAAGNEQKLRVPTGRWETASLKTKLFDEPVAVSGAWTSEDTFSVKIVRPRGPFAHLYRFRFAGDEVVFDGEHHIAPGDRKISPVTGRAD